MSKQVQDYALMERDTEELGMEQLVLKLERNQASVQRISSRLSSYKMEPTNMECFERLADLRMGFRDLARDQFLLLGVIKTGKNKHEEYLAGVQDLIGRFEELQQELASYLLLTRGY